MKLSGLLYFHPISYNRMGGTSTPLKYLEMFKQLCGENTLQKVILTTTMWDEVDRETGEVREKELKTDYWRTMLERGSTTSRFLRTRESAFKLIDPLIEVANRRRSVQLLVDMHEGLPANTAGKKLYLTMVQLVSQREDLLRRIRQEMKCSDGAGDKMILEPLQDEYRALKTNMESTIKEIGELKIPLGKRLVKMTVKFFSSNFTFKLFNVAH